MKNWINYHHLLYFKIIAEENSVSKAAKKLRLSQSTLSAQLKQFEAALDVNLFERHHKRLELTDQGRVTLEYAKNIFSLGNELYEVLHDQVSPSRVSIQVGALDSVPKQVTLKLTKDAYKAGPCQVSVVEGKSDFILRELAAHSLDLIVTNFIPTALEAKGLIHRKLSQQVISIYGAKSFKSLKKDFPHSLDGVPMILPTYDSKLRYDLDHWFKLHSLKVSSIAETQDIGLKKLMAIDGLGLIPAPAYAVKRQIEEGDLIELGKLDGVHEELFLVSAQRRIQNPIAKILYRSFMV